MTITGDTLHGPMATVASNEYCKRVFFACSAVSLTFNTTISYRLAPVNNRTMGYLLHFVHGGCDVLLVVFGVYNGIYVDYILRIILIISMLKVAKVYMGDLVRILK